MDHRENILLNIMGRYTPGNMVQNVTRDLNALQGKYTAFESTAAREAQKAQLMQEKMRRAQITSAEQAIKSEEMRRKAAVAADDAVMRSRQRLDRLTLQMQQLQERRTYATTEKQKLMYQQMYERIVLAQKNAQWQMSRNMFNQQTANDARSAAQALSYGRRTSARFGIPSQDLRTVLGGGAPIPPAATLGETLGSPMVMGGAAAIGGGLYGAYRLANYYAGFQTLTQQTAANTNLSPAALNQLRNMEIRSRQQTWGTQAGVNQAYFRALSLGYRTPGGMVRPGAAGFVRTVMQSALPSNASPDTVATMLGGTMNAYRGNIGAPRGANADWYMNEIHAAGAAGNLTVQQMAQFYGPLASMSAASQSPGSMRQGLAMAGALTAMNFRPTKAFTDVAQIFQKMEHPTKTGMTDLANIYYATGGKTNLWGDFTPQGLAQKGAFGIMSDLRRALATGVITRQQILDLFPGTRGGQGLLALLSQTGQQQVARNYAMTAPRRAQGQIETQYQGWRGTRAGQQAGNAANLGSIGLILGQPFNKDLSDATHGFNVLTGAVASFVVKNKTLVQTIANMPWNMMMSGFHGVGFAISSAVGAVKGFIPAMGQVGNALRSLSNPFGDATKIVSGFVGKMGKGITDAIPGLKSGALHNLVQAFHDAFGTIGSTVGNFVHWAVWKLGNIPWPNLHLPNPFPNHAPKPPAKDSGYTSQSALITAAGINAYPNPSNFGIGTPSWYRNSITNPYSSFITKADSQGLAAYGGGPAVNDWNFGVKIGTPVKLKGTSKDKYTLLGVQYIQGGGWYQYWRAPNGGTFFYEHLSGLVAHIKGTYRGGTVVGYSGAPTSSTYGKGAQFSITADALGSAWLNGAPIISSGPKSAKPGALPTPPPQTTKGAYGAALKKHAGQFNWAAMQAGVPVGILQAIAIRESGVGATSKFYLGYMDPTTKGDWAAQTQDAAQTISGYYNTPGTPAYHNWTVALEMYNAGPYATKAQLAAALPYARGVLSTFASLGHSTLANITGAKSKTHHFAPYANAIFSEKHALGALNRQWHGVKASLLPKTGNRGLNQHAFLQFEYDQNKLLWQIADNTAKQYAITHHMSGAWLGQMLKQDKQAYNAANQNARFRNGMGGIGATDYVRMPEWVGRCRAEAEANILRRRTEQHGKQMVSGIIHMIRFLRKIEMNTSKVAGTQGRPNHPHQLLYTIGGAASAIGNDHRLTGSNTPDWLPGQ